MSAEDIKAAELRGYSRGYAAGKKRKQRDEGADRRYAKERAFFNRALLAALPACITVDGWQNGKGEPITKLVGRVKLARNAAEEALKYFRQ